MDNLWSLLSMFALAGLSMFMILIVLLQRGRGGGLAGAFGGAGGQSALGTRAGDVFTKITVGIAFVWILLACVCIFVFKAESSPYEATAAAAGDPPALTADDDAAPVAPADLDLETPADGELDPFAPAIPAAGDGAEATDAVEGEIGGDAAFDTPPAVDDSDADVNGDGTARPSDELDAAAGN